MNIWKRIDLDQFCTIYTLFSRKFTSVLHCSCTNKLQESGIRKALKRSLGANPNVAYVDGGALVAQMVMVVAQMVMVVAQM